MPDTLDKLRIIIIGKPDTGKTTVAHIIKAALNDQGFVRVGIIDPPSTSQNKDPITVRIERNRERPIYIEVHNEITPAQPPAKFSEEDD